MSLKSSQSRSSLEELRRSWVAARLAQVGTKEIPEWCKKRGLPTASLSSFERAVGPVRAESPLKGQRGRPGQRLPKKAPAMWEWLLVDEEALDVRKMVYRLPNDGRPQADLIAGVRRSEGVRQILETGSDRELIVVALVADEKAARALRGRLERLAPGRSVRMDAVEYEDHQPSVRTWRALAKAR
jgi:hypothetical protein